MSELVPAENIERIVGTTRHKKVHYGRAVSSEQRVYVLHSHECLDSGIDLRDYRFSKALDQGIRAESWHYYQDVAVVLGVWDNRLVPLCSVSKQVC